MKFGKDTLQKRHLYLSVTEAYELFTTDYPDENVGLTKFFELRPPYVLPLSTMPHYVCVCSLHENMGMMVESLSKIQPESSDIPRSAKDLLHELICDQGDIRCMSSECSNCTNVFDFYEGKLNDVLESPIAWQTWSTEEGRVQKVMKSGTVRELICWVSSNWSVF